MGKNRVRGSLAGIITNIIVHKIVARHTNRPESSPFLEAEIIEYIGQAKKASEEFNWNDEDREYIEHKSIKQAMEILGRKYPDVEYTEKEVINAAEEIILEFLE